MPLVLRVQRGGRLLGSWTLRDEPLELSVVDVLTGRTVAVFQARAPGGGIDEVPIDRLPRAPGDDLTMPLPEPTETGETASTAPVAVPARREWAEHTPDEVSFDEVIVLRRETEERSETVGRFLEPERSETVGHLLEEASDSLGELLEPVGAETGELTLDEPEPEERPTPPGAVRSAEIWLRRRSEWHPAGRLAPGQRLVRDGGEVRLAPDGSVVVVPGPRLRGSATLLDGQVVGIGPGDRPIRLPAGASVVLRHGESGLYLRSEPVAAELDGEPTVERRPAR